MKKVLTYLLIIAGIAVMWVSTSWNAMQKISEKRNERDEWWGVHFPIEGDLVGMSYLYYEKQLFKNDVYSFVKPQKDCDARINLFVWGDSYGGLIPDSAFACIASYKYRRRYWEQMFFHLDTAQKNVLLIEIVEREIRNYLSSPDHMFNEVKDSIADKPVTLSTPVSHTKMAGFSTQFDVERFFNPHINQNLEYNLFNYNFISPARKAKAWFNYHLFNRASGNVAVSEDGKYLLLNETLLPGKTESSYSSYTDEQLTAIIHSLNAINDHYKALGFDEVYLSLVPNPVSILQPKGYNNLLPAIEHDLRLQMKYIDVYEPYTKTKEELFLRGDSHWNERGANIWVQQVNEVLYQTTL